jgi:Xaa-Pro aminopeptidase
MIASEMGAQPGGVRLTIGVTDRVWAVFLLQLQAELPRAAFTRGSIVLTALRQTKSEEEAGLLRRSGALADEAFAEVRARPFEGRSELEIAHELQRMLEARGLEVGHPPIVGSGPNGASPHHHSGPRVIKRGDLVVLDFGGTLDGYFSDMTRTVFVGGAPPADSEEVRVYRLVQQGQEAAVQAARPGMTAESLDAVARDVFREAGYGEYFIHRLGHGIGLDGHEPPYIVAGNTTELRPGMSFSVEPGLYLPGRFGVRIEDIVVLHESGAERLNNSTRDIVEVN